MKQYLIVLVCLQSALACIAPQAAEVVQTLSHGTINWTSGMVQATGYGAAPDTGNAAQKRLMAKRAAQVDAYRNLAELIEGVRVTSATTVREMMVTEDVVKTRVSAVIKNAREIGVEYSKNHDVAIVTLAIPMDGELVSAVYPTEIASRDIKTRQSNAVLNRAFSFFFPIREAHAAGFPDALIGSEADAGVLRRFLEWAEEDSPERSLRQLKHALDAYDSQSSYSGIVIDARHVPEFQLALVPVLVNSVGQAIYPRDDVVYSDIRNKRPVSFDYHLQDAEANPRVATTPLHIRAASIYGAKTSHLVIPDADYDRIRTLADAQQSLQRAGVVIVVSK